MLEVVNGFAYIITTLINFMFTLNFGDGTGITVGGLILAMCVMSLLIRFFFRQLQAGPSFSGTQIKKHVENQVVSSAENVMRGD